MKFSYSKPTPKHMVDLLTKVWVFYMCLSLCLIWGLAYFLRHYTKATNRATDVYQIEGNIYNHRDKRLKQEILQVAQAVQSIKDKSAYTTNIKESVKGILSIIPDVITIQSITIDYSSLTTIKGIVPSKDTFKATLQQRLDAIFENSHTEFTPLKNGGLRFVSTNSSVLPFIDQKGD
ncbi:hypothetical protein [Helicobacter bizzozeronii]|uniref:hypothetical protein n=1 Tax=Helicobacter bizzozeronii TaxID=56877 RepID=UPI000CEE98D1|nr:hypothetical protein [Helicobacter bizzozeronii]